MKNSVLKFLIGILSLCAIIGMVIIVKGGTPSTLELRLSGTVAAIFIFGVLGFLSSLANNVEKYKSFSKLGIAVSLITFIWISLVIWGVLDICLLVCTNNSKNLEVSISLLLLTLFTTYTSLILLIKNSVKPIQIVQAITIVLALIGNGLVMAFIWQFIKYSDILYKIASSIGILTILGTIVLLILNQMYKPKEEMYMEPKQVQNNNINQPVFNTLNNNFGTQPAMSTPNNNFGAQPTVNVPNNVATQSTVNVPNNNIGVQPTMGVPNNNIGIPPINNSSAPQVKSQEDTEQL